LIATCLPFAQVQANDAGLARTGRPVAYGVFDAPLKSAMIALDHALTDAAAREDIPAEAYRLHLCAQRFQRHYSTDAWQRVCPAVDALFVRAQALYDSSSLTGGHLMDYRSRLVARP